MTAAGKRADRTRGQASAAVGRTDAPQLLARQLHAVADGAVRPPAQAPVEPIGEVRRVYSGSIRVGSVVVLLPRDAQPS